MWNEVLTTVTKKDQSPKVLFSLSETDEQVFLFQKHISLQNVYRTHTTLFRELCRNINARKLTKFFLKIVSGLKISNGHVKCRFDNISEKDLPTFSHSFSKIEKNERSFYEKMDFCKFF